MKIKSLISNIGAATIVALSLAGCQDYDNGFTDKEIAFQEAFRNHFGAIDPNQDWNLATRGMLHVNLHEEANVKIYSANPISEGAVLMADYNVSAPTTLGFDMPEGTKDVFVQTTSGKGMVVSGYYTVSADGEVEGELGGDGIVEFDVSGVTISENTLDLSVFERDEQDGYGTKHITRNYKLHMLENVPTDKPAQWKLGDFRYILGDEGVFAEGARNWRKYVRTGILQSDVVYTMKEDGPMSVTFNYFMTSTETNHLAYFYWTGDDLPTTENITLYCLIENATDPANNYVQYNANNQWTSFSSVDIWEWAKDDVAVQGTTFPLVYFGNGKAESTFPAGTHIGFAIIQDRHEGEATGSVHSSDAVWFSLQSMNVNSKDWGETYGDMYDNGNFPTAATFKAGGRTFLGFEDWPEDTGSDLNDLMFWVNGSYDEENITEVIPPTEEEQSWMIAYEDLGNSFDWDYNDVVLKVAHTSGMKYITITPMAAGGTLASYVKFNGQPLKRKATDDLDGEIHRLLGAPKANSGEYAPINADSREDGVPIRCDYEDYEYPGGFTMTALGNRMAIHKTHQE